MNLDGDNYIRVYPTTQFEAFCRLCGDASEPEWERSEALKWARQHRREKHKGAIPIVSSNGTIIVKARGTP